MQIELIKRFQLIYPKDPSLPSQPPAASTSIETRYEYKLVRGIMYLVDYIPRHVDATQSGEPSEARPGLRLRQRFQTFRKPWALDDAHRWNDNSSFWLLLLYILVGSAGERDPN